MVTMNPFNILSVDDNDDPTQLLVEAKVVVKKAKENKPISTTTGNGTYPVAAKFLTKPSPPSQAMRESRDGSAPTCGGSGHGQCGCGRGG
ncbi:hypothetical protein GUJ93_ZPchr0006g43717 [Zizania palustris]|uniref:STM1-like N-terminal domain-containing protein n=1 Tax=Zizania palustris TaxID=103762 RepID=A0A8J5TDC3_ZIZPA|nr:hypothetical protein GUJ93_ZPchr0006g43717 [Zizania palustris]